MTEKENEFSALIIAKMAIKICESNSDIRRDDESKIAFASAKLKFRRDDGS